MKNKLLKLTYRFLLVLVSSIFIFAAIDKIVLKEEMVKTFHSFGLPKEFMVIIGFTELMLAILLQTKYFTKLATNALISILSFGIFFHVMNHQYIISLFPLSLIFILLMTLNLGQKVAKLPK